MTQEYIDRIESERELRYAFARMDLAKINLEATVWCVDGREASIAALDAVLRVRDTLRPMIAQFIDEHGWEQFMAAKSELHGLVSDGMPILQAAFDDVRVLEDAP